MTAATFETRLTRLARKHRRMMNGVAYRVRPDGLITAHPRRSLAGLFPLRTLALLALTLLAFKGLILTALGEATYLARLDDLEAGSGIERAGAWLMQPDPVTSGLATFLASLSL